MSYYLIPCEKCGLIDSTYKMVGYKHQTCPIKNYSIDIQKIAICLNRFYFPRYLTPVKQNNSVLILWMLSIILMNMPTLMQQLQLELLKVWMSWCGSSRPRGKSPSLPYYLSIGWENTDNETIYQVYYEASEWIHERNCE